MPRRRSARWLWLIGLLLASTATVEARPRAASTPGSRQVLTMSDAEKARLSPAAKQQAVRTYGLRAVALSNDFLAQHSTRYSCVIPGEKKPHRIRDQKRSGRCWIYATDRVLRSIAAQKGLARPPEMSTSFVNYHALRKLALGVLREAAAGKKGGLDPRAVADASEGGYQPWALEIIREQGFVPKSRMDTSADGASSGLAVNELQRLVAAAQHDFGAIKKGSRDAVDRRATLLARYERDVDALLRATIGAPPTRFTFHGKEYTPQRFLADYLRLAPADLDLVVLGHDPTHGFMRRRTIKDAGMRPFAVYNVALPILEQAVQQTLRGGQAVYVSTNVSPDQPFRAEGPHIPARARGVLSEAAFRYETFVPQHALSKHDRIDAGVSASNHAMAITGFDAAGKGVRKWLVENSWGPRVGAQGRWHMYEDFFRENVDEVAVPRSALPPHLLATITARSKKPRPQTQP